MPYSRKYKKRKKTKFRKSKSRTKKKSKIKALQKQVTAIKRVQKYDQGTLVFRQRQTNRVSCGENGSNFTGGPLQDKDTMELMLSHLVYYNPEEPGVLTTAPAGTGTFSHAFNVKSAYHKVNISNNYTNPCKIRVYMFRVKEDTDLSPFDCFMAGLIDVGNPTINSALVYPTDSRLLQEIWTIDKTVSCTLQPGIEKTITWNIGECMYDPATSDSHGLNFQRSFNGSWVGFRVVGTLAHDDALLEYGTGQGSCDFMIDSSYTVEYSAGADIKHIEILNASDSFTNFPVQANKAPAYIQKYESAEWPGDTPGPG